MQFAGFCFAPSFFSYFTCLLRFNDIKFIPWRSPLTEFCLDLHHNFWSHLPKNASTHTHTQVICPFHTHTHTLADREEFRLRAAVFGFVQNWFLNLSQLQPTNGKAKAAAKVFVPLARLLSRLFIVHRRSTVANVFHGVFSQLFM